VPHHVEEGLVAAELEILARRVGAERLVGLAVRVAPEMYQRRLRGDNPERVGGAQLPTGLVEDANGEVAGLGDAQAVRNRGETSRLKAQGGGRAVG